MSDYGGTALSDLVERLEDIESGLSTRVHGIDDALTAALDALQTPLPLWDRCAKAFLLNPSQWRAYAKALLAGGRLAEAIAAFEAYGSNAKTRPKAVRSIVRVHQSVDNHTRALEMLEAAVEEFRDGVHYSGFLQARADQRWRSGMLDDALADFLEVSLIEPSNPAGYVGLIRVLCDTRNFSAAQKVMELARNRIADRAAILMVEADLIQSAGWLADLTEFYGRLVDEGLDERTTLTILRRLLRRRTLFFDQASWDELARRFAAMPLVARAIADMAMRQDKRHGPAQSLEAATRSLEAHGVNAKDPKAMQHRATRIDQLIRVGVRNDALAEAVVLSKDVAGWPNVPRTVAHIIEWLEVQNGDVASAQAHYWQRRGQVRVTDRRAELVRVTSVDVEPNVIAFAQVRNEMPNLPSFLAHHRGIGIHKFVIVDNGSTDGSRDYLAGMPDVELYTTLSSYRRAVAGSEWLDPMACRPDRASTLTIRLDADERFVYPHCDQASVSQLWAYMSQHHQQAMRAIMIDMFPERLAEIAENDDHIAPSHLFDVDLSQEPMSVAPYVDVEGGVRTRTLQGKRQNVGKVPAIVGGGAIERIGSHLCSPAAMSDVTAALLHYKFRPGFFDRAREEATRREYAKNGHEWLRYLELESRADDSLIGPETRSYSSWRDLLNAGLISTSARWEAFVAAVVST